MLRHAPVPSVRGFAILASIEAWVRGIMLSVYPIAMYEALGDAERVSEVYFIIGIIALFASFCVPTVARLISRRWTYTLGAVLLASGALTASQGGPLLTPIGLGMTNIGVVCVFICFNAYIMDYIERHELGRSETLRLFYSSMAWVVGPITGIWLWRLWHYAPFLIAATMALVLLCLFWWMRIGNGKIITAARNRASPNPLRFLPRFLAQPRLVAGWLFAVFRSIGWWGFVVYMPIYVVEAGYDETIGGALVSLGNAFLLLTPLMLRWMRRRSVKFAVRTGFAGATACFFAAFVFSFIWPPAALVLLAGGAFFLILLDVSGGLPFLMAVKPGERTEMSVIYSSFRDISGIVTPGAVRLVLLVSPLAGVFAATAGALLIGWLIAGRLHPRLGEKRVQALQPVDNSPKVAAEN